MDGEVRIGQEGCQGVTEFGKSASHGPICELVESQSDMGADYRPGALPAFQRPQVTSRESFVCPRLRGRAVRVHFGSSTPVNAGGEVMGLSPRGAADGWRQWGVGQIDAEFAGRPIETVNESRADSGVGQELADDRGHPRGLAGACPECFFEQSRWGCIVIERHHRQCHHRIRGQWAVLGGDRSDEGPVGAEPSVAPA